MGNIIGISFSKVKSLFNFVLKEILDIEDNIIEPLFEWLKLIVVYVGFIGVCCSIIIDCPLYQAQKYLDSLTSNNPIPFKILILLFTNIINLIIISKMKNVIHDLIGDDNIIPHNLPEKNKIDSIINIIPFTTINSIFKTQLNSDDIILYIIYSLLYI